MPPSRTVSPMSRHATTATITPSTPIMAKFARQPKASSRMPPTTGASIGITDMPMVT